MLDRFGRKRPLYAGLGLFTVASFGCIAAPTPGVFIAFRLLQALGGCVAQVGSIAMVRDFFPARESAKILSLLLLVLSVSPLFAPSIGSLIATTVGWPWIFVFLAAFAVLLMVVIRFLLPEAHQADPAISLLPRAVLEGFHQILVARNSIPTRSAGLSRLPACSSMWPVRRSSSSTVFTSDRTLTG